MSLAKLNGWNSGDAKAVSRLAHDDLPDAEFYAQFLGLLPTAPCLIAAVAWTCSANSFTKLATHSVEQEVDLGMSAAEHAQQLNHVRNTQTPEVFRGSQQPSIIILPIVADDDVPVLVEAYVHRETSEEMLTDFVREAFLLCQIAANRHEASERTGNATSLKLTPIIHQSLSVKETAYTTVNEGRRAIDCDRVTVLRQHGDKYRVEAVSGEESVNRRANVVQYLETLVARVLKTGEAFWYPDQAQDLPPQIERELESYLEIALSRRLGILPLCVESAWEESHDETSGRPSEKEPIGAIVVEQFTEEVDAGNNFKNRSLVLVQEAAVALHNAVKHEGIFLLPLWLKLGAMRGLLRGKTRWKTATAAAALAIATALLCFVPAELKVAAEGRLVPIDRHNLFAQHEGTISTLHTAHGANVKKGAVLATLKNHDVDLAIQRTRGEIRKTESRIGAIRAKRFSHDPADSRPTEANAAAAEEENLRALLQSLKKQMQTLETRRSQLTVTSPIAGNVITWNLEQQLLGRPVQRGQRLIEVANLDGPWQLELHLPDKRVADVLSANDSDERDKLEVTYMLAADTSQKFEGRVREIAKSTRIDSENGQNVLIHVDIQRDALPVLQPGTGVQAKIHCGRRSLGYVWLRDVWYFIRSKVMFRLT